MYKNFNFRFLEETLIKLRAGKTQFENAQNKYTELNNSIVDLVLPEPFNITLLSDEIKKANNIKEETKKKIFTKLSKYYLIELQEIEKILVYQNATMFERVNKVDINIPT